jgi:hypothetical protein
MIVASGATTFVYNPLSNAAGASTVGVDLCRMTSATPSFSSFAIRYAGLSSTSCTDIVTRTSAFASRTNLYEIIVTGSSTVTFVTQLGSTTLGNGTVNAADGTISPANAGTACAKPGASGATVDWYYKIDG